VTVIAVIGSLSSDVVAGAPARPGGAVYYAARALARLGADACVVTRCAAEDVDRLVPPLEAFGLRVEVRPGERTSGFSFHYEGDDRVMEVDAIGDPWTPADVTGWAGHALDDAAWIHVGALLRSDFPTPTLKALSDRGRLLLDGQGLVRRARIGPLDRDADVDREVFGLATILKLNEDEARVLAGGIEAERLRELGVPEVVLTLGSAGALVVTASTADRVPPVQIDGAVDPTGAGDAFAAGYLHARTQGAQPLDAAQAASELTAAMLAPAKSS
jgi:sugar/nucleoside kinase (ribokinase family)